MNVQTVRLVVSLAATIYMTHVYAKVIREIAGPTPLPEPKKQRFRFFAPRSKHYSRIDRVEDNVIYLK